MHVAFHHHHLHQQQQPTIISSFATATVVDAIAPSLVPREPNALPWRPKLFSSRSLSSPWRPAPLFREETPSPLFLSLHTSHSPGEKKETKARTADLSPFFSLFYNSLIFYQPHLKRTSSNLFLSSPLIPSPNSSLHPTRNTSPT